MTAESDLYGRAYYQSYLSTSGEAYERTPQWLAFFGSVADRIVTDIQPQSAFDAGCAMGFLVEALRDRGVEASGIDISPYAVSVAREDVRPKLAVGSLVEPLDGRWDLITCIEVVEHLEPADARIAIENLCSHTDDILLSTTPRDFRESTHINVRPPEYWIEHFLRHGFVRDLDYDASYISPWAVRLRRRRDPLERTVVAYERELWRLLEEKAARDRFLAEQVEALSRHAETLEAARAEGDFLKAEAARLTLDLRDADGQLRDALERLAEVGEDNAGLHRELNSVAFRMAQRLRRGLQAVAPGETWRRQVLQTSVRAAVAVRRDGARTVARRAARRVSTQQLPQARRITGRAPGGSAPPSLDPVDQRWNDFVAGHEPSEARLIGMRAEARGWADRPLVSLLMPTYNPEPWFLRAAIDSVRDQAYDNWELCIADDASSTPSARETVAEYSDDHRIRFVRRDANGGIAAATNSAAELATGDYIALLDHDDALVPHALFEMVRYLLTHPEDDLVYSDEDKLDAFGRRVGAHLKPDWSPELLESCNYVCHLTVMRRSLYEDVGGFRAGFDGSQDYDLFLRATERARGVGHVGEVLYHWRMIPRSAAASSDAKPEAYVAAKLALESAIARRQERAWVDYGAIKGFYQVRRGIKGNPRIAVVIPTRDRAELLAQAVACVEAEAGPRDLRIVIVDNDSVEPATHEFFAASGHQVERVPGVFNFSRLVNRGVSVAGEADHILLLNNDIIAGSAGWLDALVEHSQRPEIGAVGGRLLFPDGRVQHEGDRVGGAGVPAENLNLTGYFGMGLCTRTVSAVSAACLMVKSAAWQAVGGFDEGLRVIYNDVDFCLRVSSTGYRNVYTPVAEMTHAHSASRGGHTPREDARKFMERWRPGAQGFDPYVGRHIWTFQPLEYR